jgi:hypothetical protein
LELALQLSWVAGLRLAGRRLGLYFVGNKTF